MPFGFGDSAMTRRHGVTLMEVLVAITIAGVGLLALMTLFPLAAFEMSTSVLKDRAGHNKHNFAAIANLFGVRQDPTIQLAMTNPAPGTLPQISAGPSYAVYVDPIGWNVNYN